MLLFATVLQIEDILQTDRICSFVPVYEVCGRSAVGFCAENVFGVQYKYMSGLLIYIRRMKIINCSTNFDSL